MNPKDEYVKLSKDVVDRHEFEHQNSGLDNISKREMLYDSVAQAIETTVEQDRKMRFELEWPSFDIALENVDEHKYSTPNSLLRNLYDWLKFKTKLVEIKDKGDV